MGTVDATVRVPPGTVPPRSTTARITPATNRPQAGSTVAGSALPSVGSSTRPGTSAEWAHTSRPPSGLHATTHPRSIAMGSTSPPL
jgi:hypothetical protein